jgi:probable phosphoglycerate mutase
MTVTVADIPLFARPFYFMRHGESEANLADTIAGSLDVALTELGHRQASAAAALLKPVGITAIYSSALKRAHDTAAHVGVALDLPVITIAELAERSWGELEGQPRSGRMHGSTPPGAETPQEYMQRVLQGLAKIDARGLPLIVAHSGVFRVLCRTLNLHEPDAPYANAQPVRVTPAGGAWKLESL